MLLFAPFSPFDFALTTNADHCFSQGTTFSGVAFAFATNNEAKEDIITEWPGAGSYTKQKVSKSGLPDLAVRESGVLMADVLDPYCPVLRPVPESGWLGP